MLRGRFSPLSAGSAMSSRLPKLLFAAMAALLTVAPAWADEGAKDTGKKVDLVETNAQGDVSKESSFIDSLISAGVKAIIVSPVSAEGVEAPLLGTFERRPPVEEERPPRRPSTSVAEVPFAADAQQRP